MGAMKWKVAPVSELVGSTCALKFCCAGLPTKDAVRLPKNSLTVHAAGCVCFVAQLSTDCSAAPRQVVEYTLCLGQAEHVAEHDGTAAGLEQATSENGLAFVMEVRGKAFSARA